MSRGRPFDQIGQELWGGMMERFQNKKKKSGMGEKFQKRKKEKTNLLQKQELTRTATSLGLEKHLNKINMKLPKCP